VKQALKRILLGLLGKQEQAVVVTFATGDPERVRQMRDEVQQLLPDRQHFVVEPQPSETNALHLWWTLRRRFRTYRIGMAPVLFDNDQQHRSLRLAAFLLAPTRILAYNANLERHHLQLRTWLASLLFWRGTPLDRIYLRPAWLAFTTQDRTTVPNDTEWIDARLPRPGFRRIAILTPFVPWPLSHGGAVRMHALLKHLSNHFDVYLFAFREKETREQIRPLCELCTGIGWVSKPRYREPRWSSLLPPEVREYESAPMRQLLTTARKTHGIDLLQVEFTQLARYPGDILVEHDVTHDLYAQIRRRNPSFTTWWDWWRWHRFETAAVKRYSRVITMSAKDSQQLAIQHARIVPNGVDLNRFQPKPETPANNLLFIGSFRHFPNVLAYRFLVDEVMPRLDPAAAIHLTVVSGPDSEIYEPNMPNDPRVTRLGYVADVKPLYEHANIVLVPTLVSAGTNVKVLEAMAMERAVISTPSGCGGIPVTHREHVWIAEGPDAFAEAIQTLLASPTLRAKLSASARALVQHHFDWAKLGQMQLDIVRELLPEQIRLRPGTVNDVLTVRRIQADALPSSRWDATQYLVHEFYVAQFGEDVAGFIVARKTAPDEREILNIAVAPDYRRLGIGRMLLKQLVYSGDPGDVFLEVRESNTTAQLLYEQVGFQKVGIRPKYYEDPPETAVIMRIRVP
jgi:ribosomal-protein-alanine acetyltransferase